MEQFSQIDYNIINHHAGVMGDGRWKKCVIDLIKWNHKMQSDAYLLKIAISDQHILYGKVIITTSLIAILMVSVSANIDVAYNKKNNQNNPERCFCIIAYWIDDRFCAFICTESLWSICKTSWYDNIVKFVILTVL